jgi:tetratricopeptide (TPR) repeat protein
VAGGPQSPTNRTIDGENASHNIQQQFVSTRFTHGLLRHIIDAVRALLEDEILNGHSLREAADAGDLRANLRAVLSWSAHALTTPTASLLGLLGIAPGPDISLPAAASLTDLATGQVRVLLRELENASLVRQHVPGRYRMHDLIRLYATDAAHRDLTQDVREAALRRVIDFYTHTADAADRLLSPHRYAAVRPDPPAPGIHPHPLRDVSAALAWFDIEHACLLAVHHTATTLDWHPTVWHLAWALDSFHYRRGHRRERLTVWQAAADAATHLPDATARVHAHQYLGVTYTDLGRHEDAFHHLHQALTIAEHHANPILQARAHNTLTRAWEQRGDDRQALQHAHRALALYRSLDQPLREARVLNMVGWFTARLGDYDTARGHCQAALTLQRHHHDPEAEAAILDSLGYIDHHSGRHHQAIDHYEDALTLLRGIGNTYEVAQTLDALGHTHLALDHVEQARTVWREALCLYQEQGRHGAATHVEVHLVSVHRPNTANTAESDD